MSTDIEALPRAVGTAPIVSVEHAVKYFPAPRRHPFAAKQFLHAVDDVSLSIRTGESLGLVGESGSGKSTLARVILGLLETDSGRVSVDGIDTRRMQKAQHRRLCGTAQLIFQDPHAAMDPRMTIFESLRAVLTQHKLGRPSGHRQRITEALEEVGLDASFLDRYPGGCSGGQLQRVVIARALLLDPKVLICDEPTSALDASVQANILNLLTRLRRDKQLTMLMISHDLRVIRFTSDRVAVLYLGQVVEIADRDDLFDRAVHPYTLALLAASATSPGGQSEALSAQGDPPSPVSPPAGCRYNTRCPFATDICRTVTPELREVRSGHQARCHWWEEIAEQRGKIT